MGTPLISIIVPVYGVETYLDECVSSLVNQTYKNIEIILVDDGSKDNCPGMIDKWAEKDNRIVPIHKPNGGQSSARNMGLNIAKGDYITFVDGDDWVEKEYCMKLLYAMQLYDADIGVVGFKSVYSDYEKMSAFLVDSENLFYPCVPDQAIKYFMEIAIAVWGKMYRADILKTIRFPQGRLAEEYTFQLEALKMSRVIGFCNLHLYDYRIRGDSDAHSIKPKYLLDNIQALDEAYEICYSFFPFEKEYCKRHLAALIYEFLAAKQFGAEVAEQYSQVLQHAIDTVGDVNLLLNVMEEPENITYYTFGRFGEYMTSKEKKKVQSDYRKVFSLKLAGKYKVKFFFKYLPAAVCLPLTSKLLSRK